MRRGDFITVAAAGDYGKPRPAVVVQSDRLETDSVLVCLITSVPYPDAVHRMPLAPAATTGLQKPSWVMVEKLVAVPRSRCGGVMGSLDAQQMSELLSRILAVVGVDG